MSIVEIHGDNSPNGILNHWLRKSKGDCAQEVLRCWNRIKELESSLENRRQTIKAMEEVLGHIGNAAGVPVGCVQSLLDWVDRANAALAQPKVPDGLIVAAEYIEKKAQDYVNDHGSYDYETGVTEFPDGGDYINMLEELAEEIRALSTTKEPT